MYLKKNLYFNNYKNINTIYVLNSIIIEPCMQLAPHLEGIYTTLAGRSSTRV